MYLYYFALYLSPGSAETASQPWLGLSESRHGPRGTLSCMDLNGGPHDTATLAICVAPSSCEYQMVSLSLVYNDYNDLRSGINQYSSILRERLITAVLATVMIIL